MYRIARGYGSEAPAERCDEKPGDDEGEGQWSWRRIQDHLERKEGKRVSRQRLQYVAYAALKKLQNELIDEPIIREWAAENGYIQADDV